MSLDRQLTTFYVAAQASKGTPYAAFDGSEAIEITYDSSALPIKPMANDVVRNNIRNSRFTQGTLPVGKWGETPNELGIELHSSGTAGTPPEYGLLIESLLGGYVNDPGVSDTYSIASAGDSTWYTVQSFVGNGSGTGVKVEAVDARVRSMSYSATAGEIVTLGFGIKSLTAEESDANDANTPVIDGQAPMAASGMTFTIAGGVRCAKSVEFTADNPKQDNCVNDAGIGDLPGDSALENTGTMVVRAESDEEFTKYFASTLSDIVIVADDGTIKCTTTLAACQYGEVDPGDSDKTVEYSVPFTITGNITMVYEAL